MELKILENEADGVDDEDGMRLECVLDDPQVLDELVDGWNQMLRHRHGELHMQVDDGLDDEAHLPGVRQALVEDFTAEL